jgi:simple sugar transport system ATP-binding protein
MPEVFEVADRIEVLRLGERVASFKAADVSMEDVVRAMTGALGHLPNRDRDGPAPPEGNG